MIGFYMKRNPGMKWVKLEIQSLANGNKLLQSQKWRYWDNINWYSQTVFVVNFVQVLWIVWRSLKLLSAYLLLQNNRAGRTCWLSLFLSFGRQWTSPFHPSIAVIKKPVTLSAMKIKWATLGYKELIILPSIEKCGAFGQHRCLKCNNPFDHVCRL